MHWTLRNKLPWNFNKNTSFSVTKILPKISSDKWHPFCSGGGGVNPICDVASWRARRKPLRHHHCIRHAAYWNTRRMPPYWVHYRKHHKGNWVMEWKGLKTLRLKHNGQYFAAEILNAYSWNNFLALWCLITRINDDQFIDESTCIYVARSSLTRS